MAEGDISPARWASLRAHFEHVSALTPGERAEYLHRLEETEPQTAPLLKDLLEPTQDDFLTSSPWRSFLQDPAKQAAHAFLIGDVLGGRFEIEAFIGEGGSGEVYRAFDRHRQMQIALKTIRPVLARDQSAVTTLRNELNMATQVSHPNVCRLYDIQFASPDGEGASFITMELLNGESLAARIRKQRLVPAEAHPIVRQIVSGLAAAHECGVAHRDLKSANVLLVPAGEGVRAVITDFGLARKISPGAELTVTLTSVVAGTPAYMAPEQLQGKKPTKAVDIHALGVILFEMVTGRLPFEGDTALAIAAARLNHDAPSPRRYEPALDARWEQAILACLDRNPSKRPASALDVLSALEAPSLRKWPRRAMLGTLAAAIAAGTFVAVKPHGRNPEAEAAFQRALVFNQRRTAEGLQNAIRELRRATDLEPRWAVAWSNLADAYGAASNAEIMDPRTALPAARDAARRATFLDDRLARAHGSLAWTLSLDLDEWPKAEAEFRGAIDLDAKDPEVRRWFAVHLRKLGRFQEAEEQARAGLALTHSTDPRLLSELAFLFFTARQPERFHAQVAEAHRLFPNDALVESLEAKSLELQGKFAEAMDVLNFVERLGMDRAIVMLLKAGLAISQNNPDEAKRLALDVERMWRSRPVDGLVLVGVYARLGERDNAFRIVEEAYQRKDNTLLSLATSPWVDSLRADSRFREWLQRLHFTDQIMHRMEFKSSSLSGAVSQPSRTGTS
jgi:tetratricopeptide (TPR) repeat protein